MHFVWQQDTFTDAHPLAYKAIWNCCQKGCIKLKKTMLIKIKYRINITKINALGQKTTYSDKISLIIT